MGLSSSLQYGVRLSHIPAASRVHRRRRQVRHAAGKIATVVKYKLPVKMQSSTTIPSDRTSGTDMLDANTALGADLQPSTFKSMGKLRYRARQMLS